MDNGTQKETRRCLWRVSGGPWGRDSLVEMNASTINCRFLFRSKWMIVLNEIHIFHWCELSSSNAWSCCRRILLHETDLQWTTQCDKPSQVILLQQVDCLSFCEHAEELRQAIIQAQFSKVRFYWGCRVKKNMCGCIYMNLHQLNASWFWPAAVMAGAFLQGVLTVTGFIQKVTLIAKCILALEKMKVLWPRLVTGLLVKRGKQIAVTFQNSVAWLTADTLYYLNWVD